MPDQDTSNNQISIQVQQGTVLSGERKSNPLKEKIVGGVLGHFKKRIGQNWIFKESVDVNDLVKLWLLNLYNKYFKEIDFGDFILEVDFGAFIDAIYGGQFIDFYNGQWPISTFKISSTVFEFCTSDFVPNYINLGLPDSLEYLSSRSLEDCKNELTRKIKIGLTDFSGLSIFTKLEDIRIDLRNINFDNIKNLNKLDLSQNKYLTRLYLSKLSYLDDLDLSHNTKLRSVSLDGLESLETLNLNNCVRLEKLELSGLGSLLSLDLSRNPSLNNLALGDLKYLNFLSVDYKYRVNKFCLMGCYPEETLDLSIFPNLERFDLRHPYSLALDELNIGYNNDNLLLDIAHGLSPSRYWSTSELFTINKLYCTQKQKENLSHDTTKFIKEIIIAD